MSEAMSAECWGPPPCGDAQSVPGRAARLERQQQPHCQARTGTTPRGPVGRHRHIYRLVRRPTRLNRLVVREVAVDDRTQTHAQQRHGALVEAFHNSVLLGGPPEGCREEGRAAKAATRVVSEAGCNKPAGRDSLAVRRDRRQLSLTSDILPIMQQAASGM